MNYEDGLGNRLSDTSEVNLEKYKGILYEENKDIRNIVTKLGMLI